MIYIILTQKDRSAEQLLFDYNHENMDEVEVVPKKKSIEDTNDFRKRYKKNGGNNYRKNEIKLKSMFKAVLWFELFCFVVAIIF